MAELGGSALLAIPQAAHVLGERNGAAPDLDTEFLGRVGSTPMIGRGAGVADFLAYAPEYG